MLTTPPHLAALFALVAALASPPARADDLVVCAPNASGCAEMDKKVLVIGIDGLRVDALAFARTPVFDRLIADGAFSDRGWTGDETWSGPGWASVLTGVWRDKHGVDDNYFSSPNFDEFPDIFTLLHRQRPHAEGVSIVSWPAINRNIVGGADVTGTYDSGRGGDEDVMKDALAQLARREPDLTFVHLGDVDEAGHEYGFHPDVAPYVAAIEAVDARVGELVAAVEARPTRAQEDWLLLITTDHGGSMSGHGHDTVEDRTIFVLAHGATVFPGEIWPPPRSVDIVPTALAHLGVWPDPGWDLDGRIIGLLPDERPHADLGVNLVFNGDAEFDRGFDGYEPNQRISGWRDHGAMTVVRYGSRGFPDAGSPGPEARGDNFFCGGRGDSRMVQEIDVFSLAPLVDTGLVAYELQAYLGGYADDEDAATVTATFLDAWGDELHTDTLGPVTREDREGHTGLLAITSLGNVPADTRMIEVVVAATAASGMNDASVDDIALVLSPP